MKILMMMTLFSIEKNWISMCDVMYSILEIFETNKTIKVYSNKKDLCYCAADSDLYHTSKYAYVWRYNPRDALGKKSVSREIPRTLESIYSIKYDYFDYEFEFC